MNTLSVDLSPKYEYTPDMPYSAPKPCSHAGCHVLVKDRYCDKHRTEVVKQANIYSKRRQTDRRYKTYDPRWRRIRQNQLNAYPLCIECQREGFMTAATHVDHINGDSHNNQSSNLQSLCASCHSRKTARYDGGFGNSKKNNDIQG